MSDQDTVLQDPVTPTPKSRLPVLLGVLVDVILLAVAAWALLGMGSDDLDLDLDPAASEAADTDAGSGQAVTEPVQDSGGVAGDELTTALPVVTYEVFLSRDPFDPVVPEDAPATATPTGDAPTDPTDPDDPATPTDPDDPDDPDDPATDPGDPVDDVCVGSQEIVCDGQVVSLIDITTDGDGNRVAVVQIDTTIYEVRKGDVFAERYVLLDVTATTVTIAYVDEAFTLMVGDRVLK